MYLFIIFYSLNVAIQLNEFTIREITTHDFNKKHVPLLFSDGLESSRPHIHA